MLLRDLEGNRNRTIDDGASMLLPPGEEWAALQKYVAKKTADWGVDSVTNLKPEDFPSPAKYEFFRIEKALFLDQHGWTPQQVTDQFLDVTDAAVRGTPVADARIFVQTISPPTASRTASSTRASRATTTRTCTCKTSPRRSSTRARSSCSATSTGPVSTRAPRCTRAACRAAETIAQTMYDVAAYARSTNPDRKLAVIGHSLGGGLGVLGHVVPERPGAAHREDHRHEGTRGLGSGPRAEGHSGGADLRLPARDSEHPGRSHTLRRQPPGAQHPRAPRLAQEGR